MAAKSKKWHCQIIYFYRQRIIRVLNTWLFTKHTKPSAQNTKGGIVKVEAPIHISNVMLWDAKKSAPTKVKRTRENGKLVRVSKKSGEVIK